MLLLNGKVSEHDSMLHLPEDLVTISVTTGYANDVDRMLSVTDDALRTPDKRILRPASTNSAIGRLMVLGERNGVPREVIESQQAEIEKSGGSFDALTALEERVFYGREKPGFDDRFYQEFFDMEAWNGTLGYRDAADYQATLRDTQTPHLAVTYNPRREWGMMKVAGTPVEGYAEITDQKAKGPVMQRWQNPETGKFDFIGLGKSARPVALVEVDSMILVDDKKGSAKNMPKNAGFIHLVRPEEDQVPSQMEGELPPGAETVGTLGEIIVRNTIYRVTAKDGSSIAVAEAPVIAAYVPRSACEVLV